MAGALAKYRKVLVPLAFAMLTLALFGQALALRGHVLGSPKYNDILNAFAPAHAFYRRALAHGEWPLWNPHIMSGMPEAMFGQSGLFYPPNWLTLPLNSYDAMDAQRAAHFFWALLAAFWICGRLGLNGAGAATAAVAWALSGVMVGKLDEGHLTICQGLAWFPLAWGGFYRVVKGDDADGKDWMAAVGGFAAMGLVGAPQLFFLALLVAAMTGVALVFATARGGEGEGNAFSVRSAGWAACRALAVAALAVSLSAAEWAPVMAVSPQTARAQLGPEFGPSSLGFQWVELLAIAFPGLVPQQSNEHTASVGVVGLAMAILGFFVARDKTLARVTAGAGLIALWLAVGESGGLYALLEMLAPPLRLIPGSYRFLFAVSWALSLGAGLGVDALRGRKESHAKDSNDPKDGKEPIFARPMSLAGAARLAQIAAALVFVAGAGLVAGRRQEAGETGYALIRSAIFLGAFGVLLGWTASNRKARRLLWTGAMVLVLLDLLTFEAPRLRLCPCPLVGREIGEALARDARGGRVVNTIPEFINLSMLYGYEDVNGYAATMPADFARVAAWTSGSPLRAEHWAHFNRPTSPFCYWNAVRYMILYATDAADTGRWTRVMTRGNASLWRLKEDWPRAQLFRQYRFVTRDEGEKAVRSVANSPALMSELLVEGEESGFVFPMGAKTGETASRAQTGREPSVAPALLGVNRRAWSVASLREPAWLLIHETWAPGWRARVDGQPARLYRAQYSLCAVALPAGASKVELAYRPTAFFAGLAVSLVALTGVLLALSRWPAVRNIQWPSEEPSLSCGRIPKG